jgi:hypothetical protein
MILGMVFLSGLTFMSTAQAETINLNPAVEYDKVDVAPADVVALNADKTLVSVDKDIHAGFRLCGGDSKRPASGLVNSKMNGINPENSNSFDFKAEYEDPGWTQSVEISF